MSEEIITAFKGMDREMECRGFQFEIGKTYVHEGTVAACAGGFHACEHPLDVFGYYSPGEARFFSVEQSGDLSRHEDDSKVASRRITIKTEISLPDYVSLAVKAVIAAAKHVAGNHSTGDQSAASATGDRSAASATGDRSAASATGYRSAASATGDRSAASATGDQSAASATGYRSAASATGDQSAASATGNRSAASATGYRSAASATGDQSAASATGNHSVALGAGWKCTASGKEGCALFLVERHDDGAITHVWSGIVGADGVKADTAYHLQNGVLTEGGAA